MLKPMREAPMATLVVMGMKINVQMAVVFHNLKCVMGCSIALQVLMMEPLMNVMRVALICVMMQVQAMALETKRRRDLGMLRIKAALKRIEEEEFGWCLSCGEEIAFKRLQWDPSTPNCIGCAS